MHIHLQEKVWKNNFLCFSCNCKIMQNHIWSESFVFTGYDGSVIDIVSNAKIPSSNIRSPRQQKVLAAVVNLTWCLSPLIHNPFLKQACRVFSFFLAGYEARGYIWRQWITRKMHLSISVKAAQLDDSEFGDLEEKCIFFSNKKAQMILRGTESPNYTNL